MAAQASFAIPGDLATFSGGYAYDRRVLAQAREIGAGLTHLPLPQGFPEPDAQAVSDALALLRGTPRQAVLLIDGLAFGALPASELAKIEQPMVALVHHPLGFETGLDLATRSRLVENERAALACAQAVIATSATTRDTLVSMFEVAPQKIAVAEPGVDPTSRARGSGRSAPDLLAVGALVPRKGYDVLIEALGQLRRLEWRLRIVGSPDRDRECAARLRALVTKRGLSKRVSFEGPLTDAELAQRYAASDVFVLASHYEGYGMVLAEAMARGLPIVTTLGGAAARTAPDTAALKTPPGDVAATVEALAYIIRDCALRARLAAGSWEAGRRLPRWSDCAACVLGVLERVARSG